MMRSYDSDDKPKHFKGWEIQQHSTSESYDRTINQSISKDGKYGSIYAAPQHKNSHLLTFNIFRRHIVMYTKKHCIMSGEAI